MTVKVSDKFQVVIPKAVRKQLGIKAGQKVRVQANKQGQVIIKKDQADDMPAWINKYAGTLKSDQTAWGKAGMDASEWLRRQRDNDRD